jgi:YHS domain-containing protein
MIRAVGYLILAIFLITFLRYVIGTIMKGFSDLVRPRGSSPPAELAGELKKDPVCGTFVSTATSLKKTVRGEVVYFCSSACRDKYKDN